MTSRGDAFAQLMVGAKFQRKRFQSDIEKFTPQAKSPTLHPKAPPLAGKMKALDFLDGADDKTAGSAASTDMDSEIDDAAPSQTPQPVKAPPKPGKQRSLDLRKENHIKASGNKLPPPATDFKQILAWYGIPDHISKNLLERGFVTPTPIQMQGLPCLLEGRDFIGVAPTGSGKTLTFLLPMLARLKRPKSTGLRGLILSHSKELAAQSERELRYLCRGKSWGIQTMASSKAGVGKRDVLCTTPGRLNSFIEEQGLTLDKVEYIVFDEADQLFDTSHDTFYEVMKSTLDKCTLESRQVAVLCATLPEKCEGIIRSFLRDPLRVMIGTRASASKNVEQRLEYCGKESGKKEALKQLLQRGITPPVLVFVQSIDRAKDLYSELLVMDVRVAAIHSDRTAEQRDKCVRDFRLGKINVLICTELMARGVDFKGVATVLNYDFPTSIQSYVHRVGRTGRAGHQGVAITLWTDDDRPLLRSVSHIIKSSGGEVADWMLSISKKFGKKRRHRRRDGDGEEGEGGEGADGEGGEAEAVDEEDAALKLKRAEQAKIMPVRREAISALRRARDAEGRQNAKKGGKRKRDPSSGKGEKSAGDDKPKASKKSRKKPSA
eukprot:TRINITY_DN18384_c0_g2_i1.p1 TRINITY_DN18384_c0_g2~~TRINITY_DN18384_c0_g2_i1.p1  ORF type:complete len:606 (+),score=262.00 TRINITY_DN18384_c0_g2_i1:227-2044(+)